MDPNLKILSNSTHYSGSWLVLKSVSIELDGKCIKDYEYIDRPAYLKPNKQVDAVSMVPIIRSSGQIKRKVVIIANFRPPINQFILEFPGGNVETDSIETDAFRELKEETGYIGHKILNKSAFVCHYDAWKSKENGKLLMVEIDGDDSMNQRPTQELENDEVIRVFVLELDKNLIKRIEEISEKHKYAISDQLYSFAMGLASMEMFGMSI